MALPELSLNALPAGEEFCHLTADNLFPNKKSSLFRVTGQKMFGRVGKHILKKKNLEGI